MSSAKNTNNHSQGERAREGESWSGMFTKKEDTMSTGDAREAGSGARRALPLLVLLGIVLAACATLPPAQSIQNLKSITGTWWGTGSGPAGGIFPLTMVIKEDGSYVATTPEAVMKGTGKVWVSDGKIRFDSDPSGIGGTMTLHEGDGKRVLLGFRDDGTTFKLTPAK